MAVVTSRSQLTPMVATEGAHPITLDLLSFEDARELLVRRLSTARISAESAAVEQIVTACARLPLALAIAAARARETGFPLDALAAELNTTNRRLDALDAGDAASHVRAVFSWSYAALAAPAARLFRLLGLHPRTDISAPAAASLAGHDPSQIRRLLTVLTRANLLVEYVPGRYGLHDLLHAYAAELAHTHDPEPQRQAAVTRLLHHYLHTTFTADRLLSPHRDPIRVSMAPPSPGTHPEQPTDYQQAMTWLTAEHSTLLAVLRLAADAGFETCTWQLAWALDSFHFLQGHWDDQTAVFSAALTAAHRLGDAAMQADVHRMLGRANSRLNRHPNADTHFRQALDLYTQAGDQAGLADTHRILATLRERQGNLGKALDHAQQALTHYRVAGHRRGQALALNAVGWIHALLGAWSQAVIYCQQALALLQQLSDRAGEAATLDSLGYAYHHVGQRDRAADCYHHALALFRNLGARYDEAVTLAHLGDTYYRPGGDPDAARAVWQEALDIFTDLGLPDADGVRAKLDQLRHRATHQCW